MTSILSVNEPVVATDRNVLSLANTVKKNSKVLTIPLADTLLPNSNCYWNAAWVAGQVNGSVAFGWIISQWPRSHLTAMHHAVVKLQDGSFLDVTTPDFSSHKTLHSTFILDNSKEVSFDKLPAIRSVFQVIGGFRETQDFIRSYRHVNVAEKKLSNELFAAGFRCEDRFETAKNNSQVGIRISRDLRYQNLRDAFQNLSNRKIDLGKKIQTLKKVTRHF
ncbi:Uncharacterised protein [Klebsiella quasivariicola]|uniref:hypothetical protein n=1 Tax=Klebsiella quasivariicola TaxID=2026240 RepID=UPI000E2AED8B|nr:hypothetical protein [Klebsiella quasivariicola]SXD43887.1 Uncharacterised protein [Klebsiella quasivariicola]